MSDIDFKRYIRRGKTAADISPLLGNAAVFHEAVERIAGLFPDVTFDKVAGLEAKGFILGSAVAFRLGVGLIPIRKKGKLEHPVYAQKYLDYSRSEKTLEIHRDALADGERVLLIDDWVQTGGALRAAISLVKQCGGVVLGIGVLVDDTPDEVKRELEPYRYRFVERVVPGDDL